MKAEQEVEALSVSAGMWIFPGVLLHIKLKDSFVRFSSAAVKVKLNCQSDDLTVIQRFLISNNQQMRMNFLSVLNHTEPLTTPV